MTMLRNLICTVLAMFLVLSASAQQISGSIRGTVVDPTGATVQGATVSATQTETGLTRTSTTDRSGGYVLLELPVGHYRVRVEGKGFQTYIQQGIVLDVNETATVPVRLAVGAETQHVDVLADAQLIQSTVTQSGQDGFRARSSRSAPEWPKLCSAWLAPARSRAAHAGAGGSGRIPA